MEDQRQTESNSKIEQNQSHNKQEQEKPKKKKGWLKFLIVLIVIVVIDALIVSALGIYQVPGISSILGLNKPKDLGIRPSAEALASLYEKVPMEVKSENKSYDSLSDVFFGSIPFDGQTTDVEITSFLDRFQGANSIFSDTQVKFIEGGMEVSSMVNYKIHAPAYVKFMLTQTGEKSIDLELVNGKIGLFNVPDNYLQQAEEYFEDHINSKMMEVDGFSMETLEYHDGYADFIGSYPKTVYSNDKGWSALLLE